MKIVFKINLLILLAIATSTLFVACDGEEENFGWKVATDLLIYDESGAYSGNSLEYPIGTPTIYSVAGYDKRNTYSWTVSGAGASTTSGSGEFLEIAFNQLGTFTISVSNGAKSGSIEVESISKVLSLSGDTTEVDEIVKNDTLRIPLDLTYDIYGSTSIAYKFTGDAVAGVDYELLSPNPIVIADGDDQEIVVKLIPDGVQDDGKILQLELVSVTPSIANEVVLDDDPDLLIAAYELHDDIKEVSIDDAVLLAGDTAGVAPVVLEFKVSMSGVSAQNVSISYTINGTAVTDLGETPGTLTILAGETETSIVISIAEAGLDPQTISVELTGVTSTDAEVELSTTVLSEIDIE